MAIAVEELRRIGVEAAIRIGSTGSYQPYIGLGELILASGAVRNDGASKAYVPAEFPAVADPELLRCCMEADAGEGIDRYASGNSLMAAGEKAEILTALEAIVKWKART